MPGTEDRFEVVVDRLRRSMARDWIVVAAASITLGGAFGALAVGSSSLHRMVALAPPPPARIFVDENTSNDNDLPTTCTDFLQAANRAKELADEATLRAEMLAEEAADIEDSAGQCETLDNDAEDFTTADET